MKEGEAMASAGDVIVVDEEFIGRGEELTRHKNFFCHVLMEYRDIMDYLASNIEGQTAEAIVSLVDQIRECPSELLGVGMNFQTDCDSFVSELDVADSYLY
jgi:hypothetical protein